MHAAHHGYSMQKDTEVQNTDMFPPNCVRKSNYISHRHTSDVQGHPGTYISPEWPSQRVSKHTLMEPAPSLPALFRARGKRRGFSPGAAAPQESDQMSSDFDFSGRLFMSLVFFRLFFPLFLKIGLHSLSDLRSGGDWRVKHRYSGSQRSGDA